MANYNSLKNAGMLKPVANTDLGSPTNTYGNLYMSGNVSLNGTLLNSSNAIAPRVASIAYLGNDTAANPAGGATITLTGSGFVGSSVYVGGTIAGSVSVVSSTQLTFVAPAKTAGSYSLSVVNSDGATATFVPGMQYSGIPAWSTSAGSLGSVNATTSGSFSVSASSDSTVTYSVHSGSLPSGLSLNSSTGAITGTASDVGSDTTYNFTIRATDSENQDTDRNFSITVTAGVLLEYLVVAGGGGGSGAAKGRGESSGAGAGGVLTGTIIKGTSITVTVGAGGSGGAGYPLAGNIEYPGYNGNDSAIESQGPSVTITSLGGGRGGGPGGYLSMVGGSGGGGSFGTAGQGNSGYNTQAGGGTFGGGGGAGAAATWAGGYSSSNGGDGLQSSITGTAVYYAGGGGQGGATNNSFPAGAGGAGGGGAGGAAGPSGSNGQNGGVNTGGGGGGMNGSSGSNTSRSAGSGGSGIVVLRYADTLAAASATTGSPTITVAGGYRVYKFTSSGSITF